MRKDGKGILAERVACPNAKKPEEPDIFSSVVSARKVQEMRLEEAGGSQVMEELSFPF